MTLNCLTSLLVVVVLMSTSLPAAPNQVPVPLEDPRDSELIVEVSKILCRGRIKVLFVYFENQLTHDHSGEILREVTKCDISYISLCKNFRPLEAVKDDGILMYMVMIIKDISQPLKLSLINKKSAAKHLSHVILLVRDSTKLSLGWMRASFRQFWTIWLLNIVIIFWRNDRLHVYRYNPFTNDFLLQLPLKRGELPTMGQLFPTAIPNMHRKPLRMCLYMDEVRAVYGPNGQVMGTDGLLSDYIAERLNATRIITRPITYSMHNQTADLCAVEIANEFDDIAMNIRFLAPGTFQKSAEWTVAHSRDDLCVIVPKAKSEPIFWNIFRSFGALVWLSILISMILANVCCYALNQERDRWLPLQLFCCILSQPVWHTPRNISLRVFLVFWLYFAMLICNAFKCNLTSMLVYRKPLPDINDLGSLAASPYKILVRPVHMKHIKQFLNNGHQYEAQIWKLMVVVPDRFLLNNLNRNVRSFAYLEKYHIAKFQVNARQHMHTGRPVFHLMNSCLVPYHAVYTVPYGSPYLGFFNKLLRSAYEFGFERYWDRIMNSAFIKSGTKVHRSRRSNNGDDPVVLKLEHYHAVFFLWAIGALLSFLGFLWELLARN
ncbi:uncharacterized protein LOC133836379 isoform X1 [Drosophila sulfurigaster albostrigata]|uniref:uncharacterized protein LOC133836379 isoform X1 n=2 Tax=Drosophila sulfurigaster albostrigata TaxID=89887 RepID=UPI002D21BDD5|nr:uncharacterized protein LOC133836379 isoform X1 [Drosophila sulfurigaster albostrigata]